MNSAAAGWSISGSAAAIFRVLGALNGLGNRYFVGGNRLYCRSFPAGISEISLKGWVFHYTIGCANKTRRSGLGESADFI